jgi:hypothetical protein
MAAFTAFNRARVEYRKLVAKLDGTAASYEDQKTVLAAQRSLVNAEGLLLSGASVSPEQLDSIEQQYPLPRYTAQAGGLARLAKGEDPLAQIDRYTELAAQQYADKQGALGIRLRDDKGNIHPGTHFARGQIANAPEERSATVEEGQARVRDPYSIDPQTGKRALRDPARRLQQADAYLVDVGDSSGEVVLPSLIENERAAIIALRDRGKLTKQQKNELGARETYLKGLEERQSQRRSDVKQELEQERAEAEDRRRAAEARRR